MLLFLYNLLLPIRPASHFSILSATDAEAGRLRSQFYPTFRLLFETIKRNDSLKEGGPGFAQ